MSGNANNPGTGASVWQYTVIDSMTRSQDKLGQRRDELAAMQQRCNEMGAQGWELVSVVSVAAHYGATTDLRLFFKRQAQ